MPMQTSKSELFQKLQAAPASRATRTAAPRETTDPGAALAPGSGVGSPDGGQVNVLFSNPDASTWLAGFV